MSAFVILSSAAEHLQSGIGKIIGKDNIILCGKNRDGERYFPDGEVYVKIAEVERLRGERVVIIHSGSPKPSEGLLELENILQILNDVKTRHIEVFFTYFPYGMQDMIFDKGEANVAEGIIKKLVFYYNVRKIYIIDAHFGGRDWLKKYPVENISAASLLLEAAKKELGPEIIFASPDKGGHRRTNISGMSKKRINSFSVELVAEDADYVGKIVGVVDDMIKTGGTLVKFYEAAKKAGAKDVVALITHGVMPAGISRIGRVYKKVYLTNTIDRKEANVDVVGLICQTIGITNIER